MVLKHTVETLITAPLIKAEFNYGAHKLRCFFFFKVKPETKKSRISSFVPQSVMDEVFAAQEKKHHRKSDYTAVEIKRAVDHALARNVSDAHGVTGIPGQTIRQ